MNYAKTLGDNVLVIQNNYLLENPNEKHKNFIKNNLLFKLTGADWSIFLLWQQEARQDLKVFFFKLKLS